MCGIAGYIDLSLQRPASAEILRRMTDSLAHRGPDADGHFTEGAVGLGHRRLAIIDLHSGQQPMFSDDKQIVLTYNGEIYNYIELRQDLIGRGHRFQTDSDSEVLLAAYSEWGTRCVEYFNGMWAFAIWDKRNHRLFCSRDRMGEKPFFYSTKDNTFVFGSEIKALFAYGVSREPNWEVLDALLSFLYIPAPHTFFKQIMKLPPGHSLIVENGNVKIEQHYNIPMLPDSEFQQNESKILRDFEELLYDSVRIRMRSDVPFGAFLSGGLDSGSVVAAMAETSQTPVTTCTIGFSEKAFDERDLAKDVANRFQTKHFEQEVDLTDGLGLMPVLAWHFDEPFGDSSALPTYIVSKIARKKVKMVLTGDGGDEVLSGYSIHHREYVGTYLRRLYGTPLLSSMLSGVTKLPLPKGRRKIKHWAKLVDRADMDLVSRIIDMQNGFTSNLRTDLLKDRKDVRPAREFIDEVLSPYHHCSDFTKFNYWLSRISLPDDMLCKVDRASMANSLETRIPFLDHRLVDLLATVPAGIKLKHFVRKYILRQTVAKKLPNSLLSAPKKGFSIPLARWISEHRFLKEEALNGAAVSNLDCNVLEALFSEASLESSTTANGIWTLGMLSLSIEGQSPAISDSGLNTEAEMPFKGSAVKGI